MLEDVIRVLLADEHGLMRTGVRAVLRAAPDIEVVGEATSGEDAVALAARLDPDVVIMDLSMPGMGGADATRTITAGGRSRVLVLTMHAEDAYLLPVLEAGAAGFLRKSGADTELIHAVRAVAHGDPYVSATAASVLAREIRRGQAADDARRPFEHLTPRERDVFLLVARGNSGSEIGDRLCISPKTVDSYKQRLNEKLRISHRAEYAEYALRLDLLSPTVSPAG